MRARLSPWRSPPAERSRLSRFRFRCRRSWCRVRSIWWPLRHRNLVKANCKVCPPNSQALTLLIHKFWSAKIGDKMDGATIPRSPSSSVGNYLKAIWESAEEEAASTKDVADRLSVSQASVTNMFVGLREMGLVEYERYHGASLTEEGLSEALRLVRRHRLIETFLLDQLGYSWEEVH